MKPVLALGSLGLLLTLSVASGMPTTPAQVNRSYDAFDSGGSKVATISATQTRSDGKEWAWSGGGTNGTAIYNAEAAVCPAVRFDISSASGVGYADMESNGASGAWVNLSTGDTGTLRERRNQVIGQPN